MSLPTDTKTLLRLLNYGSPIAIIVYYFGSYFFALLTLKNNKAKPISKWRKIYITGLSFVIALINGLQAVQYVPWLSSAPEYGLIHSISMFLVWLSISLILASTDSPLPSVYAGTAGLDLILEIFIASFTFSAYAHSAPYGGYHYLEALQTVNLVALAAFTASAILLLIDWKSKDGEGDSAETQSLLSKSSGSSGSSSSRSRRSRRRKPTKNGKSTRSSRSSSSSSSRSQHLTVDNQRLSAVPQYLAVPSQHTSASQSVSEFESVSHLDFESGSDSDSDDDDEKELLAAQQQKLEDGGGWVSYLKSFKVFVPYVIPQDNLRLQIYFGALLVNLCVERALNVLQPRQYGIVVDKLTTTYQIPWKDLVIWFVLDLTGSSSCGVPAINEMLENRLAAWSRQQLATASVDHIMGLSMNFHDSKDSGEVIKAIEQAGSLNEILRVVLISILPAALDIVVAMWYVTHLFDIYALFIVVAMFIGFVFVTYHITILATAARRLSARRDREESKLIYESIGNWFTISCFNQKAHAVGRVSHAVNGVAVASLRNDDLYTFVFAAQEFCEILARFAVTLLAVHRIVTGRATIGTLVTLESYWDTITHPLYVVGQQYRSLNSDLVDAERLLQLFQESPAVQDMPGAESISNIKGEVEFNDVDFAYEDRKTTIRDISLTAKPGQTIALVGETGSGKSTIFKLLMRFYDVTGGSITIDGRDIRSLTLNSLRNCFGYVPQDSVPFNMSILENVRFGRLDATDEEVYAACKAASIHDKIMTLPKGYATLVGERGIKLSGGERQRIAIARVFLKNAPIVLLDEATSAMDSHTEGKIQGALKRLVRGRTTFVIAHRLSTIVEADNILVIHDGEIVETGSHAALLERQGRYFELWSKQAALPH